MMINLPTEVPESIIASVATAIATYFVAIRRAKSVDTAAIYAAINKGFENLIQGLEDRIEYQDAMIENLRLDLQQCLKNHPGNTNV